MLIADAAKSLEEALKGKPWFANVIVGEVKSSGQVPSLVVYVKMDPKPEETVTLVTWEGYSVQILRLGAIR